MAHLPKAGDRVRMVGVMPEDPCPIPVGEEGTVLRSVELTSGPGQIFVQWDSGRSLILLSTDPYKIVQAA